MPQASPDRRPERSAVDDYLSTLPDDQRHAFERVRDLALEVVPDAGSGTSYGMAALTHRGKPLLAFAARRAHLAVYPCSGSAVDDVREVLAGFSLSSGAVRFSPARALPDDAVRRLVRYRRDEIDRKLDARDE